MGISPRTDYSVIRFSSWGATHNQGEQGFTERGKTEIIQLLREHGDVYIFDEDQEWDDTFNPQIPPDAIHDLLYHANMYIGDSGTMSTEAALLGTPVIRCNSFTNDRQGKYIELQDVYGLLYSTPDEKDAIKRIQRILTGCIDASLYKSRRNQVFSRQEDVTEFMTDITHRLK